jgi:hypothetical protein
VRGGFVLVALPTMTLLFILHAHGLVPDSGSSILQTISENGEYKNIKTTFWLRKNKKIPTKLIMREAFPTHPQISDNALF